MHQVGFSLHDLNYMICEPNPHLLSIVSLSLFSINEGAFILVYFGQVVQLVLLTTRVSNKEHRETFLNRR